MADDATDPTPPPEPPLVLRPDGEPPLVLPVEPPPSRPPRPGFFEGGLLTIGFAIILFGTLIGIVLAAVGWVAVREGVDALTARPGAKEGSVESLPPVIAEVLAWSFVAGYAAALIYSLLICRVVIGRGWTREVGLRRLPPVHLLLALISLPGFVITSDVLARLAFQVFGAEVDQSGDIGELFKPFHWSFAVLAIGVGPGVVEELWCRGFLGRGFVGRYGWVVGVGLASLFFGLLHLYPPPYVLVTAAMGIWLHFTYAVSRSLWVPVTIHLLNNSIAGLMAVGMIPTEGVDVALNEASVVITTVAVGALLLGGLAMWTARGRPTGDGPHAGVMVPPGVEIVHGPPNIAAAVVGGVCSFVLVWLLFA
jgi:uncharacterized protein